MRLSLLLAALATVLVACTTTEAPSDPTTNRGPRSEDTAASCVLACRVALEACGNTPDDRDLVRDCVQSCPFTDLEAACLAHLECGDDVSACD